MTDGFLNILKPPGMSSHDVIGFVRHTLGIRKVGHAGTLDPGAAGVLPVAVGRATRLLTFLEHADKEYRAELTFGYATDSGDDLGNVLAETASFAMPSEEEIERTLEKFRGDIVQVPPTYSAIKIAGKRACDLARAGKDVAIPSRTVHIENLALVDRRERSLVLDITCSRGTYIRTLCQDIGTALGIPAVMSFLVRRRVGAFHLGEALTLEELAEKKRAALLMPQHWLNLPHYILPVSRAKAFVNGLSTDDRRAAAEHRYENQALLAVFAGGRFLGIGRWSAGRGAITPYHVYAQP